MINSDSQCHSYFKCPPFTDNESFIDVSAAPPERWPHHIVWLSKILPRGRQPRVRRGFFFTVLHRQHVRHQNIFYRFITSYNFITSSRFDKSFDKGPQSASTLTLQMYPINDQKIRQNMTKYTNIIITHQISADYQLMHKVNMAWASESAKLHSPERRTTCPRQRKISGWRKPSRAMPSAKLLSVCHKSVARYIWDVGDGTSTVDWQHMATPL